MCRLNDLFVMSSSSDTYYRFSPPSAPDVVRSSRSLNVNGDDIALDEWKARVIDNHSDGDVTVSDDDDDEHESALLRNIGGGADKANAFVLKSDINGEATTEAAGVGTGGGASDGGGGGDGTSSAARGRGDRWWYHPSSWAKKAPYYIPILMWLPQYEWRTSLLPDVIAGITVGVMLVPQGLTYAGLAFVPPIYGLYAAFFPILVYVVLGSSRHLSVGPEVTTSILIGNTILTVVKPLLEADQDPDDADIQEKFFVPVALALTMLIGLFSFLLGLVRLGFLDSILSRPILAGFINAVALILISEQLNALLGIKHTGGGTPAEALVYAVSHISQAHLLTVLISVFCIVSMLSVRHIKSCFPDNVWLQCFPDILFIVVIVTSVSYLMDFEKDQVAVLGLMKDGFVMPQLPALSTLGDSFLITSALTITMLGFVESQLVSKKFANKHEYQISPNRELVALGLANMIGSIFGAYSAFGSLPRTKVSETAGCKSNITNLVAAAVCLMAILFILPLFQTTPRAVTSSIIFTVALSLVEYHEVHFIYRVRQWKDMALMFTMTAVTFFFGVDTGVFFAFAACLLLAVKKTTLPGVKLLGRGYQDDEFSPMTEIEKAVNDIEGVLVYKLDGPLYFANAEKLKDSTRRMEKYGGFHVHPSEPPKPMALSAIIFDMSSLTSVDASALAIMEEIVRSYVDNKRRVVFVQVARKILGKFALAGLLDLIGYENLFKSVPQAVAHIKDENLHNLQLSSTNAEQKENGAHRVDDL